MPLDRTSFLGSLGFSENPFVLTNADEEPDLQLYFVHPPYFPAVIGSPTRPKSAVVFAPRGGGKTAQKVMIERKSSGKAGDVDPFLCLLYDSFVFPERFKPVDATSEWHLNNIARLLVMALLAHIDTHDAKIQLTPRDAETLAKCARNYLYDLTEAEFSATLKSIRSPFGRAKEVLKKNTRARSQHLLMRSHLLKGLAI